MVTSQVRPADFFVHWFAPSVRERAKSKRESPGSQCQTLIKIIKNDQTRMYRLRNWTPGAAFGPYEGHQMIQVITDQLLINYLQCRYKSYLRLRGRSGLATEYSALCSRLDARYRASASQWLAAQSTTGGVSRFGGSRLEDRATADAIILEAAGVADGLEANFDGLQRTPGDSRLGPYPYRPIRFCRHPQPNSAIRLLLAFDALILGHLQNVRPDIGILLCGPAFKRIRVHLIMHLNSLAAALKHLRIQSTSEQEPPLMLNRHCNICEFKQLCRAKAIEADNLTLLSGMTSKEIAHHNSKVSSQSNNFRTRSARDGLRSGKSNSFTTTLRSRRSRSARKRCMCSAIQS